MTIERIKEYSVWIRDMERDPDLKPDTRNMKLEYEDLRYVDLSGADLEGCTFTRCKLRSVNFRNSKLLETKFEECDLSFATFLQSTIWKSKFDTCFLYNTSFQSAEVKYCSFLKCEISRSPFGLAGEGAYCFTNFQSCDLVGTSFQGTDLKNAKFTGANLHWTHLPDTFLDLGMRSDGHYHHALYSEGDIFIRAGCRFFELETAKMHWSTHNRGRDCPLCIESLLKINTAADIFSIRGFNVGKYYGEEEEEQ